jgi:ribosomal subunit interface protein
MKIHIHCEKIELSPEQESYVTEKIESLRKYCDKITNEAVQVRVGVEHHENYAGRKLVIKATMTVPNAAFRAEVKTFNIEEGVDLLHDKLYRQIDRYKTKHMKFDPISASQVGEVVGGDISDSPDFVARDERISKRKLFSDLIPMSETEAIDTMKMLGHTFFVFVNAATDRYNLVYLRHDSETYGLMELEHQEGVTT